MRRLLSAVGFGLVALTASTARPCGGGFGVSLELSPSQKIVLAHTDGIETYVFSPHSCGAATEFGLILPIPGTLTSNPELADKALFTQLDELTEPEVIQETVCNDSDGLAGGMEDAGMRQGSNDLGVDVIERGQVGMFDYVLLQADTSAAFTDWLDANGFPYDAESSAYFAYYVNKSWYFVAFRVTAGPEAPPEGSLLCGDLGPLSLSFELNDPIVPSRIAAVGAGSESQFNWRVFAFSDQPLTAAGTVGWEELYFAGALTDEQLVEYPLIASVAEAGTQLTVLDVHFYGADVSDDITLTPSDGPTEYRTTQYEYTYVDCIDGVPVDEVEPTRTSGGGGCSLVAPRARMAPWLVGLGLSAAGLGLWRRRRRSRTR